VALEIVRRIRGNVHESIDVSELEDAILTHPYLQRMRRIKQLAFLHYAFPGATHSRFEHVLGVMHLAGVAWDKLKANQRRLSGACSQFADFMNRELKTSGSDAIVHGLLFPTFSTMQEVFRSDYVLQVIRLAGLLHDLGHPPFSHSGERFLPSFAQLYEENPGLPDYLDQYLLRKMELLREQGLKPDQEKISHEEMSILMIDKVMNDVYQRFPKLRLKVVPRDVIAVLCSDIEPSADSFLAKYNIHRLCRELVSGELDIDRMDYLLRDSRECGVVYGIFDAGRIFDSLCLYYNPLDCGIHIAIRMGGLPAFEDYLRARHSMYLQLYFHKTSVAAEAMFEYLADLLGGFRLPANIEKYAQYDENSIGSVLIGLTEKGVNAENALICRQLIRDLLYDRNLWKRVYEISSRHIDDSIQKRLGQVRSYLDRKGYRFRQISSSESLTSFRPRGYNEPSRNYLRLVKKDELQFPRVYPIEDFSTIIQSNDTVFVHRIYCESKFDTENHCFSSDGIKRELAELFAEESAN
jgi:HD superfamily phosphohydrolase